MFKGVLKYIFHKIYNIGKFEDLRILNLQRKNYLNEIATIDETAWISDDAAILNKQNDKSKIRIGKKSRIMGELFVNNGGGEIEIGEDCFVGPNSKVWSWRKIKIGNRVLIAHNVNIHDSISHSLNSKERHDDFSHFGETGFQKSFDFRENEIVINDDAWIGFNATIFKGVTIGKGAIVGANTLIMKDVPPFAVVVGNPTRIIKYTS